MNYCPYCMQPLEGETCIYCGHSADYSPEPGQMPVGMLLKSARGTTYQLGAVLGQGGFGITYAAMDLRSMHRVAVKEYYPSHCANRGNTYQVTAMRDQEQSYAEGKQRFIEEATMLATVGALSSVVAVLDHFEANGTAYLVMEFLDGVPLHGIVTKTGKMPTSRLLPMLPALMEDLEVLHRAGVIHRDISPDNLMLMPNGKLKLLDFGSARIYQDNKTMTMLLKAGFSPIEQYQSHGQGAWSDVYAFAATIYYCLTGVIPPSSVDRITEEPLLPPRKLGAQLTSAQEKALLRALAVQAKNRYQSMEQFRRDLFAEEKAISAPVKPKLPKTAKTTPTKTAVPPTEDAPAAKKPLNKKLLALCAAAVAVVAAVSVILLSGSKEAAVPPETSLTTDAYMQTTQLPEPVREPDTESESESETKPEMPADYDTSGTCGENAQWSFNEATGELTITGTGEMDDYSYSYPTPWKNLGIKSTSIYGVTTIGERAFYYCDDLTSVTIGDSVTSIGEDAFYSCHDLANVTLGDSVISIGERAFHYCDHLTEITIPDSVTTIGTEAFVVCKSLTEITIPDSVTAIGTEAFASCDSLTDIYADSASFVDGDGVLYTKDMKTLVQYPAGKTLTSYAIPDSVTTIGESAFYNCDHLTEITIPDSVTAIGADAFYHCNLLSSVYIPNSVTTIGDSAFYGCFSLSEITIPSSVTAISDGTFYDCYNLTNVTIPDSVTAVGHYAFFNCRTLPSITIPKSVTTIGTQAFINCFSLTDVYYGGTEDQWNSINFYSGNKLTKLTIHYNS